MKASFDNWKEYMDDHIKFYNKSYLKLRKDKQFVWSVYRIPFINFLLKRLKDFAKVIIDYKTEKVIWFDSNAEKLFSTRELLEDDLSKLKYDLYIVLKVVGHNKYFYPRTNFSEFLTINSEVNISNEANLSDIYGDFTLKNYNLKLFTNSDVSINLVTYAEFISLTNLWMQYFVQNTNLNFIPKSGDTVFDCGACLGDTAMLFLACVGADGQVHTFDPVPLHNRYIHYQASLNPTLSSALSINQLAVGDEDKKFEGEVKDVDSVTAGGLTISDFSMTTIDKYCEINRVSKIDFIKMDIEGAESSALRGAAKIIDEVKPKLSIAAYHKDDDLWEIPYLMKKLNPEYKIYFDHHLPIFWEACFYGQ
jgi:FkbM family methyltransferase